MNKHKFVEFLRQPESVSDSTLNELEHLVDENPYFHSAHIVIARASRLLKNQQAGRKINTAAIYATSRKALKKYIQGDMIFTGEIPAMSAEPTPVPTSAAEPKTAPQKPQETQSEPPSETPQEKTAPTPVPEKTSNESLISEVYENIEEWKKSRNHFLDYELSLEDSSAPEPDTKKEEKAAPKKATKSKSSKAAKSSSSAEKKKKTKSDVDKIKSQIAEEIIAEEQEVEKAIKGIDKKKKEKAAAKKAKETAKKETKSKPATRKAPQEDNIVDEEVEKEGIDISHEVENTGSEDMQDINRQKESLKLSPGNKGGKKFRLNILNRPGAKSKVGKKTTKEESSTGSEKPGKEKKTTAKKTPKFKATISTKTGSKKSKAGSPAKDKASTKKKDQAQIIDSFIKENPTITPSKTKKSDVDLSEKSNVFPDEVITENIAEILVKQGKLEKAINVYKKLIEAKPDKKAAFTKKIKALDKELSDPNKKKLLATFGKNHPDIEVSNWTELEEVIREATASIKTTPEAFFTENVAEILETCGLKRKATAIRKRLAD